MAFTYVRGWLPGIHNGIDLAAARGTPVHAVRGGSIVFAGWGGSVPGATLESGGGNVVHVDVGGGTIYQYAHLDSIAVARGQSVGAGAVLGGVGETGFAFGYHLHFGIWDGSRRRWIDPATVIAVPALIAAVGGNAVVTAASDTAPTGQAAADDALLARLGIPRDPSHVFTADEAMRIATDGYGVTGDVATSIARTITGMTVGAWEAASGPISTSGNPLDPTFWVGVLGGLFDPQGNLAKLAGHLGQGLVLGVLALVGAYLLVKGGGS